MKDNSTSIRPGSPLSLSIDGDRRQHQDGSPLWSCAQGRAMPRQAVPHGHWKTTTFTASLRYDGIAAPGMVLDGPMNGEAFSPMSNRRSSSRVAARRHRHYGQSARSQGPWRQTGDRGRRRGSLRYLPPYSPDFNPIEMAFAKLKALLRAAAAREPSPTSGKLSPTPFAAESPRNECANRIPRRRRIRCNVNGKGSSSAGTA